jgi:hypothetical protein
MNNWAKLKKLIGKDNQIKRMQELNTTNFRLAYDPNLRIVTFDLKEDLSYIKNIWKPLCNKYELQYIMHSSTFNDISFLGGYSYTDNSFIEYISKSFKKNFVSIYRILTYNKVYYFINKLLYNVLSRNFITSFCSNKEDTTIWLESKSKSDNICKYNIPLIQSETDNINYFSFTKKEPGNTTLSIDYPTRGMKNKNNRLKIWNQLKDLLNSCEENRIAIDLFIRAKDVNHANHLIFEKAWTTKDNKVTYKKDKYKLQIWNIYRYDPNGVNITCIDEYLKKYIFIDDWTNYQYKGLLLNIIAKKLNIKKKFRGWNPLGTCYILSIYLIFLAFLNPLKSIDSIAMIIHKQINKLDISQQCNYTLIELLFVRYIIELIVKMKKSTDPTYKQFYSLILKKDMNIFTNISKSPIITDNFGYDIIPKKIDDKINQYFHMSEERKPNDDASKEIKQITNQIKIDDIVYIFEENNHLWLECKVIKHSNRENYFKHLRIQKAIIINPIGTVIKLKYLKDLSEYTESYTEILNIKKLLNLIKNINYEHKLIKHNKKHKKKFFQYEKLRTKINNVLLDIILFFNRITEHSFDKNHKDFDKNISNLVKDKYHKYINIFQNKLDIINSNNIFPIKIGENEIGSSSQLIDITNKLFTKLVYDNEAIIINIHKNEVNLRLLKGEYITISLKELFRTSYGDLVYKDKNNTFYYRLTNLSKDIKFWYNNIVDLSNETFTYLPSN